MAERQASARAVRGLGEEGQLRQQQLHDVVEVPGPVDALIDLPERHREKAGGGARPTATEVTCRAARIGWQTGKRHASFLLEVLGHRPPFLRHGPPAFTPLQELCLNTGTCVECAGVDELPQPHEGRAAHRPLLCVGLQLRSLLYLQKVHLAASLPLQLTGQGVHVARLTRLQAATTQQPILHVVGLTRLQAATTHTSKHLGAAVWLLSLFR